MRELQNDKNYSALDITVKSTIMTTKNLTDVKNKAEKAYELINELISHHSLDMMDLAYPEHNGEQDADVVAEMMSLRQTVNSLSVACDMLVYKLTEVIRD